MSSLMRLLSHRSSAAEGGNEGRGNTTTTGFASTASASSTPKSGSSFPASPSINDFSMGTAADIAEWGAWELVWGRKVSGFESLGGACWVVQK